MDDKWRHVACGCCSNGLIDTWGGWPAECQRCSGSGVVWIRPSGHLFRYPGGPACGMTTPDEYDTAILIVLGDQCTQ